ncbi:exonuclease domain-containing protein [Streptomyces werraensis]|uniref:3'-5' exonuclease n=1 Tax=Streptomyces werraensis TaxID=68284 RepID=UPI0037D06A98
MIKALPYEWNGGTTGSKLTDSYQEKLRQRELAGDALAWAKSLRPGEATAPGERILLSLGDIDVRYGAVIGLLTGPNDRSSLFISAHQHREFLRLPRTSTPGEVAHALCRLARAADRRAVEEPLQEATAEGSHPIGWFPGKRIVVLDLETTGRHPDTARIVEAAWLLADHRALAWDSVLINPGVPIPEDAYNIHSIDDMMVRNDGVSPLEALDILTHTLAKQITNGATLVIFNRTYDLPLLDAECRRHSLPTLADRLGRPVQVVDPMRISQQTRRAGSHALADLALLYSPGNLAAHSALGDCLATWDVLAALCKSYDKTIVRLLSQRQESVRHDEPFGLRHLVACSSGW